jgi:hypothetical protein
MFPFLDPGSSYFENPDEWGFTVFYRTVEEHRRAMMRASLINRTNYETRWLSRYDLVNVSYKAIRDLFALKGELGLFPPAVINPLVKRLDDAREFINVVHPIDCIENEEDRKKALREIGDEIRRRNNEIFTSGVVNQAFPINRKIGGRWYDELLWDESSIQESCN